MIKFDPPLEFECDDYKYIVYAVEAIEAVYKDGTTVEWTCLDARTGGIRIDRATRVLYPTHTKENVHFFENISRLGLERKKAAEERIKNVSINRYKYEALF